MGSTKATEVPDIIIIKQCPTEYKSSIENPNNIFPLLPTKANIAINIGVEQGDDKTPPNIPKKKAPNIPLLFLGTLHELCLDSITPISCNPTKSIIIPSNIYQSLPPPVNNLPAKDAIIPNEVNVIIIPKEKNTEYFRAVFLLFLLYLFTYPIIKGSEERMHGLKEDIIPPKNDINKAKKTLFPIKFIAFVIISFILIYTHLIYYIYNFLF